MVSLSFVALRSSFRKYYYYYLTIHDNILIFCSFCCFLMSLIVDCRYSVCWKRSHNNNNINEIIDYVQLECFGMKGKRMHMKKLWPIVVNLQIRIGALLYFRFHFDFLISRLIVDCRY